MLVGNYFTLYSLLSTLYSLLFADIFPFCKLKIAIELSIGLICKVQYTKERCASAHLFLCSSACFCPFWEGKYVIKHVFCIA